jgi:hypothetical protein
MRTSRVRLGLALATILLLGGTGNADAHAIAGQRLFPSTLTFDDPGIGAEFPLVFSRIRTDGGYQNDLSLSLTKPITPGFSLLVATDHLGLSQPGAPATHGWGNVSVGGVWQVYRNADTESIGSFSISDSIAHTGSRATRDSYSTWSPEFDFGKGFGNARAAWMKPFALSGLLGLDLPTDSRAPRMLDWGTSLQYNVAYLQDFVKYVGIKPPFNKMIPIVELPMQTCLDRGCRGQTTGYVSPGVIWIGHYFQAGFELQVPVNHRSGHSVGILFGVDLYLDDLAPHGFGAPLFH